MIDSLIGSTRSAPLYMANSVCWKPAPIVDIDAHNVAGFPRVPVYNGVIDRNQDSA
jgi:hypothetical protein